MRPCSRLRHIPSFSTVSDIIQWQVIVVDVLVEALLLHPVSYDPLIAKTRYPTHNITSTRKLTITIFTIATADPCGSLLFTLDLHVARECAPPPPYFTSKSCFVTCMSWRFGADPLKQCS
jgi:hypothetical protein